MADPTRLLVLLLTLSTLAVAGCFQPTVRELHRDALPNVRLSLARRACAIHVPPPVDERSESQRDGGPQRHTRAFVPLVVLNFVYQDILELAEADNLGGDALAGDVGRAIAAALERNGPCAVVADPGAADLVLDTRIRDLYGASAAYRGSISGVTSSEASAAGGTNQSEETNQLTASGQVTLAFTLREPSGASVDRWVSNAGTILDPEGMEEELHPSLVNVDGTLLEDHRSQQVVKSLRKVLFRLPARVDAAVADRHPGPPPREDVFRIVRLAEDFEHLEVALVEAASGRVLAREVIRRPYPVFSRPGRWVLSPYQPSYLSRDQYEALVAALSPRYRLSSEDNLTAARFEGLKEP